MNIIIPDNTHEALQQYVIDTIEFGSVMKGTNDQNSDHDYLHIISPSTVWLQAPYNTHHLLQFKDGIDSDHIYCTPHTFVKGLLDGDSTIFHEIHKHKALTGTCLEFLQLYKFDHYTIQRAYLGIARRDLKESTKLWNGDNRKSLKKVQFAIEAYNYVLDVHGRETISVEVPQTINELQRICQYYQHNIETLRNEINNMFDAGKIPRTSNPNTLMLIDRVLGEFEQETYTTGMAHFRQAFYQGQV